MRLICFGIFFILNLSWSVADLRCLELFTSKDTTALRPLINDENYSWRRFTRAIDSETAQSPIEKHWLTQLGKKVPRQWGWLTLLRRNNEVYESIHIAPDHGYIISRSNLNVFRIQETTTGNVIATIDSFKKNLPVDRPGDRFEVIALNSSYFVIARESLSRQLRNQGLGTQAFQPESLSLFNLKGQKLSTFSTIRRLKGAQPSQTQKVWLVADQYEVLYMNWETQQHYSLTSSISLLRDNIEYAISALTLSADSSTVYVAYSPVRSKPETTSYIISINITSPEKPVILKEIPVKTQLIYKMYLTHQSLHIEHSRYEDSREDIPRSMDLPLD